jgi:hypothetical protein
MRGLWIKEAKLQNCDGCHSLNRYFCGQISITCKTREMGAEFELGSGVMFAVLNRAWPLAGLTVGLAATVGWVTLIAYVFIELM